MERPYWQRLLYNIWPKIYRTIDGTVFWLLRLVKSTVKEAIKQIKFG